MKNTYRLILTAIIFTSSALTLFAQPVLTTFDNTWYGFNAKLGEQNYFLNSGRVVDIDNDGDSDVVGSRYFAGFMGTATGFVVLKNIGGGMLGSSPVYYPSTNSSDFVYSAKLNNDAYADIIVSNTGNNYSGNSISVYFNLGNGTFGSPANYFVGGGPVGIAAEDFNGDDKTDLAVATRGSFGSGNTVTLLINSGDGTFEAPVLYPAGNSPVKLSAGKINTDNFIDLAVANENGMVNVLMNSGSGNFSNRTEYTFILGGTGYLPNVKVSDIDNDSDLDILYSNNALGTGNAPAIGLLRNSGGIFSDPELIQTTGFAAGIRDVETADLNNDGWNDIITANANARATDGYQVMLSNGSGGFLPSYRNNAGQNTEDVMIGDMDNDGKIDILTSDSYSMQITVHKNPGTGIFPVPSTFETGNSFSASVDFADIDGDLDLDAVVSASGRTATGVPVRYMKNLGNGNFDGGTLSSIRGGGVQAKFRDLNGDSKPDILFATAINSAPYDFHYAINNGDGTFGAVQTKPLGSCGWYDIDATDLDNDGDNDVIITEWLGCPNVTNSSRRIYICTNDGNSVFANPIIKVVSPQPAPIAYGDFNSDGKKDIITGSAGAIVEISMGIGNGDLLAPVSYSIGDQGGATDIVVEDFNGDGKPDIASSNFWEGTSMSVLYGNGNGTFQTAIILPSAYSPDLLNVSGITAGDLDNDGDKDIIVGNNASNSLSLYYNNNGTFEYKMRAGAFLSVFSPVFADIDNDGKGDIGAVGSLPPSGTGSTLIFMKGSNTGLTSVAGLNVLNIPEKFSLEQNYPNPFNPVTVIRYSLNENRYASLKIFDATGKETATLVNGVQNAGTYLVEWNASSYPSGVYFYKLETESYSETKRMILLK
ncbi:MAG: T9SS type A sorting domain-containing protein [Ignavibacteria bacterium]|nr:T9SS type A sorting domain-containing protein [Ignavibacteria bacterium]